MVCVVEAVEYLGLNGVKVSELVEGLVGEVVESSQNSRSSVCGGCWTGRMRCLKLTVCEYSTPSQRSLSTRT